MRELSKEGADRSMRVPHVLMGGPAVLRSGLPAAALFRGCTQSRRSGKPTAGHSSGGYLLPVAYSIGKSSGTLPNVRSTVVLDTG
jgi:hypothetical protein